MFYGILIQIESAGVVTDANERSVQGQVLMALNLSIVVLPLFQLWMEYRESKGLGAVWALCMMKCSYC